MERVTLRIAGAGLQTTVQDLGRPAHLHAGVPGGGAMDRLALRAANLLVGNDERDAGLEAALIGPTIVFETAALFALGGADLGAALNGEPIHTWSPVAAAAGSTLRFGQPLLGCRTYIAIAGGIEVPPVFGSRSTYIRGGFGGLEGRALRAGDTLSCGAASPTSVNIARSIAEGTTTGIGGWSLGATLRPRYAADAVVRVIEGAHTNLLTATAREALFGGRFRVSSSSDRMGYRLEGDALTLREPTELLSEAVAFGTIQLPPGGAPIILMADRQTTGGYPRIGEVASVDLPLVAQLRPGDSLRFHEISLDEAQRQYLRQEAELSQARAGIALRFGTRIRP